MKQIAFLALVFTLLISQFNFAGATISNNTIAIALMMLLLVLFSELTEFDFWGIRGRRKEEELKKLVGEEVIAGNSIKPPSPYKVRQAEKSYQPGQTSSVRENFLSLSFEVERLLNIIAQAISRQTATDKVVTPNEILESLKNEKLLTPSASLAIEKIREVRQKMLGHEAKEITPEILEATQVLAAEIYAELKTWLENSRSGK